MIMEVLYCNVSDAVVHGLCYFCITASSFFINPFLLCALCKNNLNQMLHVLMHFLFFWFPIAPQLSDGAAAELCFGQSHSSITTVTLHPRRRRLQLWSASEEVPGIHAGVPRPVTCCLRIHILRPVIRAWISVGCYCRLLLLASFLTSGIGFQKSFVICLTIFRWTSYHTRSAIVNTFYSFIQGM